MLYGCSARPFGSTAVWHASSALRSAAQRCTAHRRRRVPARRTGVAKLGLRRQAARTASVAGTYLVSIAHHEVKTDEEFYNPPAGLVFTNM